MYVHVILSIVIRWLHNTHWEMISDVRRWKLNTKWQKLIHVHHPEPPWTTLNILDAVHQLNALSMINTVYDGAHHSNIWSRKFYKYVLDTMNLDICTGRYTGRGILGNKCLSQNLDIMCIIWTFNQWREGSVN